MRKKTTKTLKELQHHLDIAYLPYHARLLRKAGYAVSTIANILKVRTKEVKDWCQSRHLNPKHRISLSTYKRSPRHRQNRIDTYHRQTRLTNAEQL